MTARAKQVFYQQQRKHFNGSLALPVMQNWLARNVQFYVSLDPRGLGSLTCWLGWHRPGITLMA